MLQNGMRQQLQNMIVSIQKGMKKHNMKMHIVFLLTASWNQAISFTFR